MQIHLSEAVLRSECTDFFMRGTKKSEKKSDFDLQNEKTGVYYKHTNEMCCGCSSMVEPQPSKLIVRVRFPSPAPISSGGVPERPKGADCKSAVADFDGSNPSPTTIFFGYLPKFT